MIDDILLLHRRFQVTPHLCAQRLLLTPLPLFIRPPAGQYAVLPLRHVQELLEVRQGVVSVVESAGIASELVVVLDTHAVAVNQLAKSVFLGELVEVVVRTDALEEVAGHFGHGVEIG